MVSKYFSRLISCECCLSRLCYHRVPPQGRSIVIGPTSAAGDCEPFYSHTTYVRGQNNYGWESRRRIFEMGRYVEAQAQFKRVIHSGLVHNSKTDAYSYFLALAYHQTLNYDAAAEILGPLYCKRLISAETELVSQQNGLVFREGVYQLMIKVSYQYWLKGHEFERKGDDFAFRLKLPGTSLCIAHQSLSLIRIMSRCGPRTVPTC